MKGSKGKNQKSPGLGSFGFKGNGVNVRKSNPDGSTNTSGPRKKSTKND